MVKRKILALAASALLVAVTGLASTAPANASQQQICTDGGVNNNGDCMNNWFGEGPVYAYLPNKSNEAFYYVNEFRCGSSDVVTSTCPFTNQSMDSALLNHAIIQIPYQSEQDGCVSDPSESGSASLDGCNNDSTGTGGAFASIWVIAGNGSLVSVGWTNLEGEWYQLNSLGGSEQLGIYPDGSNATEWNPNA
jgi:hypothetical protein